MDRRQGCQEPGAPRRMLSAYCARVGTQVLQASTGGLLRASPVPVPATPGVTEPGGAGAAGSEEVANPETVVTVFFQPTRPVLHMSLHM